MATQVSALASRSLGTQSIFTGVMGVIGAFFAAAGWVQTADTGQINMATNTSGYQLWGMNDTLQGTSPWFLKVGYSNTGTNEQPAFTVQFGTATDGAGNFTGTQISQIFTLNCSTSSSVVQRCYFSGDTNRITWNLWDGPTQYEGLNLGVERTKDGSGADTGDGLLIFGRANGSGSLAQGASQVFSQILPTSSSTGLPIDAQSLWAAAINLRQNTMASGASVGWAYPIPFNGAPYNNGKNFLIYQGTDFPAYTIQTLSVYGANHSFLVCTPNAYPPTQPPAGSHVLMRFE